MYRVVIIILLSHILCNRIDAGHDTMVLEGKWEMISNVDKEYDIKSVLQQDTIILNAYRVVQCDKNDRIIFDFKKTSLCIENYFSNERKHGESLLHGFTAKKFVWEIRQLDHQLLHIEAHDFSAFYTIETVEGKLILLKTSITLSADKENANNALYRSEIEKINVEKEVRGVWFDIFNKKIVNQYRLGKKWSCLVRYDSLNTIREVIYLLKDKRKIKLIFTDSLIHFGHYAYNEINKNASPVFRLSDDFFIVKDSSIYFIENSNSFKTERISISLLQGKEIKSFYMYAKSTKYIIKGDHYCDEKIKNLEFKVTDLKDRDCPTLSFKNKEFYVPDFPLMEYLYPGQ